MKDQWRGRRDGSWIRQLAWACAGFLFLATVLFAPSHKRTDGSPVPLTNQFLLVSNNHGWTRRAMPWYIRSGQWRADMRSLAAALRYLTDLEQTASAAQTNLIPSKASNA